METLLTVLTAAKNLMETPLTIYGFTLNFWGILIWSIVAGIVIWFIFRLIGD